MLTKKPQLKAQLDSLIRDKVQRIIEGYCEEMEISLTPTQLNEKTDKMLYAIYEGVNEIALRKDLEKPRNDGGLSI